ncbi:hypothetical protein DL771_001305 [Monosporascus sp. 5C6A]|nr:hypothetical protein DL771_001305 [Monosporascus sp. 5C6A]
MPTRYLFSPSISGFINRTEVTLGLAMTCITYLCQPHNDQECSNEELQENVLSGFYSLHDYSSHTWFELILGCISSSEEKELISQLTSPLQLLLELRANNEFSRSKQVPPPPRLECFKETCPDVYDLLCNVASFRRLCEGAEHSKIRVRIYKVMNELLCRTESHKEMCYCDTIRNHYGRRIFKCSVVDCQFRRHGFETRSARAKHASSHTRPWKCADPSCEYANGGFVSRKMRDRHLERYHQRKRSLEEGLARVASTTCSVKLAHYLISRGANVEGRQRPRYRTPLRHAARRDSYEAAKFMRFLLLQGADPYAPFGKLTNRIEDEKGPKNISKWLGKSWDAVVAEAKEELGRGNPDQRGGTSYEALTSHAEAFAAEEESTG